MQSSARVQPQPFQHAKSKTGAIYLDLKVVFQFLRLGRMVMILVVMLGTRGTTGAENGSDFGRIRHELGHASSGRWRWQ